MSSVCLHSECIDRWGYHCIEHKIENIQGVHTTVPWSLIPRGPLKLILTAVMLDLKMNFSLLPGFITAIPVIFYNIYNMNASLLCTCNKFYNDPLYFTSLHYCLSLFEVNKYDNVSENKNRIIKRVPLLPRNQLQFKCKGRKQ